jgi:hypothetical protein
MHSPFVAVKKGNRLVMHSPFVTVTSVDRHVQCVHQERELHDEENALLRERLTSAEGLQWEHFSALRARTQCVENLLGDVIDNNARSERAHAMMATLQNERMVS